jgi:hypothetical protein
VSQVDFYSVWGSEFGLVDADALLESNFASGGPVIDAVGRMMRYVGQTAISQPRSLSLLSIAQRGNAYQFAGDGTAAHPPLYNRDVLGVFPFQSSNNSFVVGAYVMTRNIAELYDAGAPATDLARYDLPPELYRLRIGGVDGAKATVAAYDPLWNQVVRVAVVGRTATTVTIQVPLTDSPRILRIDD